MLDDSYYAACGLSSIHQKIINRERLDYEDGLILFKCEDLTAIGSLAHAVRTRLHGKKTHYVVNRQVNYTNVCVNDCVFCAFRRNKIDDAGAFALDEKDILERIEAVYSVNMRLDELHIVGGCNPVFGLTFFESLFAKIKSRWPALPIKAFTPIEIAFLAKLENIPVVKILTRLKAAGLEMLAGGGAEIFDEALRVQLCPSKADAREWLEISGIAHSLGIKSNCTMLYGHIETDEQRLDHLLRLRKQQDLSAGFTCFIPLRYLPANNRLKNLAKEADALQSLKVIAISRLILDNIAHIKAYWIMLGQKLAQTALWYGADDLDGTIVEEHIGHMAGASASNALGISELEEMIKNSGFAPVRRNALFTPIC